MLFKIQFRGTLEDKIEEKFSLAASDAIRFVVVRPQNPNLRDSPGGRSYPGIPEKTSVRMFLPSRFFSLEKKKSLSRKVAGRIRLGVWQFKQMLGIRFMFGRTTDLNHFQTVGTLEHLMSDVRWLEHAVP